MAYQPLEVIKCQIHFYTYKQFYFKQFCLVYVQFLFTHCKMSKLFYIKQNLFYRNSIPKFKKVFHSFDHTHTHTHTYIYILIHYIYIYMYPHKLYTHTHTYIYIYIYIYIIAQSVGECGVPLHCHRSQVHSGRRSST